MMKNGLLLLLVLLFVSCKEGKVEKLSYRVVSERPHDVTSYTQGLEFRDGKLLESSGGYGKSNLRIADPQTGALLHKRPVATSVFAEGLTVLNNELWLLSWKEGVVTVLDPAKMSFIRSHRYSGEGWGLTNNGKELIMSDGSATLKFLEPGNFTTVRSVEVKYGGMPVKMLNELEYADGVLWANVYLTDKIVRIDPKDGRVTGWLDLTGLRGRLAGKGGKPEVLNGIARDPSTGRYFVTGKHWPLMFELEIRSE